MVLAIGSLYYAISKIIDFEYSDLDVEYLTMAISVGRVLMYILVLAIGNISLVVPVISSILITVGLEKFRTIELLFIRKY